MDNQVLNSIDVYVEDEQLLFEAALTQDPITLYTEETPEVIMLDTMKLVDSISRVELEIKKTSKEATLLAKVAELKEALNTIDFTAIEQAIQGVEDITAKEATLIQGVEDIIKAVENIDFTELENSIAEVKNAVANIDFSALAEQSTLLTESQVIQEAILNIDLSSVESKVEEVGNKIDNIDLTPIENKVDEGVSTLSAKIDNIKLPEIDTTELAKQGENTEATNSAILSALNGVAASMYKGVPVVTQTTDATIAPNVWNVWGDVTNLTITKGTDIAGIVNNYMIHFIAGEGCAVTFSGFELDWFGGEEPTWTVGNTYEISIVDNIALWVEIEA